LALVGFVNAFNMIDGVDGLAGSTGMVMLELLAALGALAGDGDDTVIAVALMGSLAGFCVLTCGRRCAGTRWSSWEMPAASRWGLSSWRSPWISLNGPVESFVCEPLH
jgi:hypothetical protein